MGVLLTWWPSRKEDLLGVPEHVRQECCRTQQWALHLAVINSETACPNLLHGCKELAHQPGRKCTLSGQRRGLDFWWHPLVTVLLGQSKVRGWQPSAPFYWFLCNYFGMKSKLGIYIQGCFSDHGFPTESPKLPWAKVGCGLPITSYPLVLILILYQILCKDCAKPGVQCRPGGVRSGHSTLTKHTRGQLCWGWQSCSWVGSNRKGAVCKQRCGLSSQGASYTALIHRLPAAKQVGWILSSIWPFWA